MQTKWIGYRVKGFVALADRALYWDMICKTAEQRYKILLFWQRHGLAGAAHCRWRPAARLDAAPTRPKQLRQRQWPAPLIAEIRRLRGLHPNLGKEKLAPFIERFCQTQRLPAPSARTIGRLIADAPDKMRGVPQRVPSRFGQGFVRPHRERKPKNYRAGVPGACIAWDSIERRRDGMRRYLISCTDLASRFAFSLGVKHLSSNQALLAWQLSQIVFPATTQRVLSDNGQEFAKHFHAALTEHGIVHWHTFPRTPKMNAHAQRFNRTLQDEFVDYYEDLLFDDLPQFNQRLLDYLFWFNAERPHHALTCKPRLISSPYISAQSARCIGPVHNLDASERRDYCALQTCAGRHWPQALLCRHWRRP